jgi:predicted SprT family Zn-dependent metalloprotease
MDADVDAELQRRAGPVLARLAELYDEPRVLSVPVRASGRLTASLARAYLSEGCVRVAVPLVASRHLEEVLVHELAHLVCHWRHGRVRPHGRQWRALVELAGQPARVRLAPTDVRLPRRRRPRRHRLWRSARAFVAGLL